MSSIWNAIVGHEWAVDVLRSAILYDRVGHAYLITGPAQVGKTTLALTFAQALLCSADNPAARPCGSCDQCVRVQGGHHPDVQVVEPEISSRGRASIKIETMRELQRGLQLAPFHGRYKIAILTGFDAANANAANAFLKTLEEPPEHVILILTATEADSLLDTIRSRCRVVAIRPLPTATIEQTLTTTRHLPPEEARRLAHAADGRLGWALHAVDDPSLLQTRSDRIDLLRDMLGASRVERFKLAGALKKQSEQVPPLLQLWLSFWRDALLLVTGQSSAALTHVDYAGPLSQLAHAFSAEQILAAVNDTQTALWQLERNANVQLVLENLLLSYPRNS